MKKIFFFILGCILFALLLLVFNNKSKTATIDGQRFFIEVAKTPTEQQVGFAKYNKISHDFAMYFPFRTANYYTFWMKDMHFPIDIIFIKGDRIVTLYKSVPAPYSTQAILPTYSATSPADSVLEISAGLSKKYGFKIGDSVVLSY